jgi:hypothetical protein
MRAADPSSKALVFSQYNSTLEWLQRRLPEEGFSFRWEPCGCAQLSAFAFW